MKHVGPTENQNTCNDMCFWEALDYVQGQVGKRSDDQPVPGQDSAILMFFPGFPVFFVGGFPYCFRQILESVVLSLVLDFSSRTTGRAQ